MDESSPLSQNEHLVDIYPGSRCPAHRTPCPVLSRTQRGKNMRPYKNFTFPLNVYSHILCKDYGDFEYLHYGLFEQDDQDIRRAQQRATDLLFSHLPPSPCRILEVGIGLGTTLSKLVKAGYDATGITPDENQITTPKISMATAACLSGAIGRFFRCAKI